MNIHNFRACKNNKNYAIRPILTNSKIFSDTGHHLGPLPDDGPRISYLPAESDWSSPAILRCEISVRAQRGQNQKIISLN